MLFLALARIDSSAGAEIDFVTLANLPPVVRESFENSPQAKRYAFSAHINPFYLCDSGNAGDNFSGLDAWHVFRHGPVQRGADGKPPPKLRGDALMVIKTEAASGLIYWDGKRYGWYQQGD